MHLMHRFKQSAVVAILAASGGFLCAPQAMAEARLVTNAVEAVSWTSGVSYTYDGAGNVRKIGGDTFVYDHAGRVVEANVNDVQRNYEYDAFGNRTKCLQDAGTASQGDCQHGWTINRTDNRVAGVSYDDVGNLKSFANHAYSYDDSNMVTRDDFGTSGLAKEFIYTADDERIATYRVGSSWSWTVRDVSGKVLREFTSSDGPEGVGTKSWTWAKDYVWRDGQMLASRHVAGAIPVTYHYHLDHLGSARRVTDQNDLIVGSHDYMAFGPEVSGGLKEPAATTLKYTGHERDTWVNESVDTLDYMHARYYNPEMGRFLSVDPIIPSAAVKEPQRWNRYAYVSNNPIKNTDPTGKLLEARASECGYTTDKCYTKLDAYQAIKNWVGKDAAKYLQLGKNGQVTLKGISAANFVKLGGAAAIVGNLIRSTSSTAALALSANVRDEGGNPTSAYTRLDSKGTLTEINPGMFPRIEGGATQTIDTALAHDLGGHGLQSMWGVSVYNKAYGSMDQRVTPGVRYGEAFAITMENIYRASQGMDIRGYYVNRFDYDPPQP